MKIRIARMARAREGNVLFTIRDVPGGASSRLGFVDILASSSIGQSITG
jgi:hypothetical protein